MPTSSNKKSITTPAAIALKLEMLAQKKEIARQNNASEYKDDKAIIHK